MNLAKKRKKWLFMSLGLDILAALSLALLSEDLITSKYALYIFLIIIYISFFIHASISLLRPHPRSYILGVPAVLISLSIATYSPDISLFELCVPLLCMFYLHIHYISVIFPRLRLSKNAEKIAVEIWGLSVIVGMPVYFLFRG